MSVHLKLELKSVHESAEAFCAPKVKDNPKIKNNDKIIFFFFILFLKIFLT